MNLNAWLVYIYIKHCSLLRNYPIVSNLRQKQTKVRLDIHPWKVCWCCHSAEMDPHFCSWSRQDLWPGSWFWCSTDTAVLLLLPAPEAMQGHTSSLRTLLCYGSSQECWWPPGVFSCVCSHNFLPTWIGVTQDYAIPPFHMTSAACCTKQKVTSENHQG